MPVKYYRCASKHVYYIMTRDESWIYAHEPESKQQATGWVFQEKPNPTKTVRLFFRKKRTCRNRNTRTTQSSKFCVVHNHLIANLSSKKSGKPITEDGSHFTTPALTHRPKQLHFRAPKTSI